MLIGRAVIEDAVAILELQRLAYRSEAVLYDDWTIPPLTQTLEDLQTQFGSAVFLKAVEDGRIVGSVRAHEQDATCHVARLIVHPDSQRRGIGRALLTRIESEFPDAGRFSLFTGHKSTGNIRLYERAGYRLVRSQPVNDRLTLVFMEKTR